jgi:hypothetical protein
MFSWYRGYYVICIDPEKIEGFLKNKEKPRLEINRAKIRWTPTKNQKHHLTDFARRKPAPKKITKATKSTIKKSMEIRKRKIDEYSSASNILSASINKNLPEPANVDLDFPLKEGQVLIIDDAKTESDQKNMILCDNDVERVSSDEDFFPQTIQLLPRGIQLSSGDSEDDDMLIKINKDEAQFLSSDEEVNRLLPLLPKSDEEGEKTPLCISSDDDFMEVKIVISSSDNDKSSSDSTESSSSDQYSSPSSSSGSSNYSDSSTSSESASSSADEL